LIRITFGVILACCVLLAFTDYISGRIKGAFSIEAMLKSVTGEFEREFKISVMEITEMTPDHWPYVKAIYEDGIATGNATFQTSAPEWEEWDNAHVKSCRMVAVENGEVIGWAALTPVSGRCVYAGVGEVSVYVDSAARGNGLGKALLTALIKESERHNFWTLQAGIFPENAASIKIHQSSGFRMVGTREKIGQMDGVWRDTILLERRSRTVGA
jgi:L-amino acid N-acyltransferase YncA